MSKETKVAEKEGKIVVDAKLMAKYPVQSERTALRAENDRKVALETRTASIAADKAALVSMRERYAVDMARSKEPASVTNLDALKASADELDAKIKKDEQGLEVA